MTPGYDYVPNSPPITTASGQQDLGFRNPYLQRSIMHAELATSPWGVILPVWRFGSLRRKSSPNRLLMPVRKSSLVWVVTHIAHG